MALLLAINELTSVAELTVAPGLGAFAMVRIVLPLTAVQAALLVGEDAESVRLATFPLSLVNVAIGVLQSAFTLEQAVHSETCV